MFGYYEELVVDVCLTVYEVMGFATECDGDALYANLTGIGEEVG